MLTLGMLFWLIMLLALIFGAWRGRGVEPFFWGGGLVVWILFLLVGLRIFGVPIHGG